MSYSSIGRIASHLMDDDERKVRLQNRRFRNFAVYYWDHDDVHCLVRVSGKARSEVVRLLRQKGYPSQVHGRLVKIRIGEVGKLASSFLAVLHLMGIQTLKNLSIHCL